MAIKNFRKCRTRGAKHCGMHSLALNHYSLNAISQDHIPFVDVTEMGQGRVKLATSSTCDDQRNWSMG